jgi:fructokinase
MTESDTAEPGTLAATASPDPIDDDVLEPVFVPQEVGAPAVASEPRDRRALVIGEALIDAVHRPDGSIAEHPGGSPANVALGLGRLGRGVDLLTWIGTDHRGRVISEHLAASGVVIVPGSESASRTSVATATLGPDGAARYEFDLTWHVPERWASPPAPPLVVHTGSIAAVLEPGGPDVANVLAAHRESATLTYDPNVRPSLMPPAEVTRTIVEGLVAIADVVKVSDEDLAWLAETPPLQTAERWARSGPALVVVTMGDRGAVAMTSDGRRVEVGAPTVPVADTVGAGDAFMAGLIDGLWSADLLGAERRSALRRASVATIRAVLDRCARIAAITVSRPGADPPRRGELTD